MKRAILLLVLAASLAAQKPVTQMPTQTAGNARVQVWVTAKGKTYHSYRDCGRLEHSAHVLVTNEAIAQQHGLIICKICLHRHDAKTGANSGWAQPEIGK
jgi:hypothetical protein